MPFNIPNEGVPYYRPVAPEVPVAPRGAEGDRLGSSLISAMTQHAIAMENSKVDQQKMIQAADLKARELDLDAKKASMEYDLRKKYYDILSTNAGTNQTRAWTAFERLMQGSKDASDVNDQIAKLNADVDTRAKELQVVDPEFQTKNPIGFAANLQKLTDEYGTALAYTGIPDKLTKLQRLADQQKIPFAVGSDFMPADAKHPSGWTKPIEIQNIPAWQLARDYQDPTKRTMIENGLKAAGQHMLIPDLQRNAKGDLAPVGEPKEIVSPSVQNALDAGKNVDFSHSKSRLPDFAPKSTRGQAVKYGDTIYDPRTSNSGRLDSNAPLPEDQLTEPDLPPDANAAPASQYTPEPTKTDMILGHARNALAANPAARDEIMRRLQGYGIDPNALTAAA